MMTSRFWNVLMWMSLTALLACEHEDPCDDAVSAAPGACQPAPEPEADAAMTDDDAGETPTMDSGSTEPSLGAECTTSGESPECKADAPYCAKSPFDDVGYCTVVDCSTTDDQCPVGYTCFLLGIPNVPPYCARD